MGADAACNHGYVPAIPARAEHVTTKTWEPIKIRSEEATGDKNDKKMQSAGAFLTRLGGQCRNIFVTTPVKVGHSRSSSCPRAAQVNLDGAQPAASRHPRTWPPQVSLTWTAETRVGCGCDAAVLPPNNSEKCSNRATLINPNPKPAGPTEHRARGRHARHACQWPTPAP